MARTWLIDSRNIARKVKNATQFSAFQTREWGQEANRECPKCHHLIDNSDVLLEWPGLPAGVKFDPSDPELLEHLAGKVGLEGSKPHLFIDEFIPTLHEDKGICYTHPENLPGVKKDGTSVHFFHRTTNAYATGHRKRRKIHGKSSNSEEHVRWHKTGRTKPVIENGVQRGFKKIMVLYKSTQKGTKPDKSNWVMHQYHLGSKEDEEEGEYVVSKIFYQQQPKQIEKREVGPSNEEPDISTVRVSPRTPKTSTPYPPRSGKRAMFDEVDEEKLPNMPGQDPLFISETAQPLSTIHHEDKTENSAWWAGESQAAEEPDPNNLDDSLLCHEILDSFPPFEHLPYFSDYGHSRNNTVGRDINPAGGISELDNIDLDTPPDFQLADLQFGSQESIMGWLDRL